jgi:dephospho-CoA kinase
MTKATPARVVVLTGGIGAGKSMAMTSFERLGVPCLDADDISRQLTASHGEAMAEIISHWGPELACPDGSLNRAVMRDLIFREPPARQALEAILHPRVQARAQAFFESCRAPYLVYVVPLWFEIHGFQRPDWVWRIVTIAAPMQARLDRLDRRSPMPTDVLEGILQRQSDDQTRAAGADHILHNEGSPAVLDQRVVALHTQLKDDATAYSS